MSEGLKGSCVCGAVAFEVKGPFSAFYTCHCSRCQKTTGSSNAANLFAPAGSVRWLAGRSLVTDFSLATARYFNAAFCSVCGSPVPRHARSGDFEIVPAGALDDPPPISPDRTIFWSDRAPWFEAACEAARFDGYGDG
jgi:hypothetical protein